MKHYRPFEPLDEINWKAIIVIITLFTVLVIGMGWVGAILLSFFIGLVFKGG